MLMDFSAINKNNLHHAYFLEGDHEQVLPKLLEYLEGENIAKKESVSVNTIPVFYIENSREIKEMQQMVADEARVIIVAFDRMIMAAQQALLKTLEEPTENTHFIFINRNSNSLLPTVRSRLFIVKSSGRSDKKNDYEFAKDYLSSDLFGRMDLVKDMISGARGEDDEDDDERASSRRGLVRFLDSLEELMYDLSQNGHYEYIEGVQSVISAKKDLEDPSPSIKMIFEHLAHRLPRFKKVN